MIKPADGDHIYVAKISPDQQRIALALRSGNVKILDARTGQTVHTFVAGASYVKTLDWSPDGKTLVTGSNDKTVRAFDTTTWTEKWNVPAQSYVDRVEIDPTGGSIAITEFTYGIRFLQMTNGAAVLSLPENVQQNAAMAPFSPSFVGSDPYIVFAVQRRILFSMIGQPGGDLLTTSRDISVVRASSDSRWIAVGQDAGGVTVYSLETGDIFTVQTNTEWVTDIAFTPTNNGFVTTGRDSAILWTFPTDGTAPVQTQSWQLPGNADSVDITAAGKIIVSAFTDKPTLFAMHLPGVSVQSTTSSSSVAQSSIASSIASSVVSQSSTSSASNNSSVSSAMSVSSVSSMPATASGALTEAEIAAAFEELRINVETARLVDTAEVIQNLYQYVFTNTLAEHMWSDLALPEGFQPKAGAISDDNHFLLVAGNDGRILIYVAGTGELFGEMSGDGNPISRVAFLGARKVLVGYAQSIKIMDLDGTIVKTLPYDSLIESIQVIPDKRFVVTVNGSPTQQHRQLFYSPDGTLTLTHLFNRDWDQFSISDDASVFLPSGGPWISGWSPAKNTGIFDYDLMTLFGGSHPSVQKVAIEGNETAAHIFMGIQTDGQSGIRVTDIKGKEIVRFVSMCGGQCVKFVKSLGGDAIVVGAGNSVMFYKLEGTFLGLVKEVPMTSGTLLSAELSTDGSTVIALKSNGVVAIPVPPSIADNKIIKAVVSKLSIINFEYFPDDVAGRQFVANHRAQLHDLVARANPNLHLTYSADEIFAKFIASYPQYSDAEIAKRAAPGSYAWQNEMYVRNAEYQRFRDAIGSYDAALSKMVEAAYNAVVTQTNLGDPTPYLRQVEDEPKSQMYGTSFDILRLIGIIVPDKDTVVNAIKNTMVTKGDDLIYWQTDSREEAQRVIYEFNHPDSNYAGSGERTSFTSTEMEEMARKQAIAKSQSGLVMYAGDGVTPIGIGGKTFEEIAALQRALTGSTAIGDVEGYGYLSTASFVGEGLTWNQLNKVLSWYNTYRPAMPSTNPSFEEIILHGIKARLSFLEGKRINDPDLADVLSTLSDITGIDVTNPTIQFYSFSKPPQVVASGPLLAMNDQAMLDVGNPSMVAITSLNPMDYVFNFNPSLYIQQFAECFATGIRKLKAADLKKNPIQNIHMTPRQSYTVEFEVQGDSMVNVWFDGVPTRNVNLKVNGVSATPHGTGNAESLSLRLSKGTYTAVVTDGTASMTTDSNFIVALNISVQQFSSANIPGRVSVESPGSMPVMLRSLNSYTLDVAKPIWIVAHGRTDSPDSGKMKDLTKSLTDYAQNKQNGAQVVVIDWNEAAKDFNSVAPNAFDLSNSRWTKAIGEWTANSLINISEAIDPSQVSGFFHSHGNGVGYHMAKKLFIRSEKKINLFVGLDVAKNPPGLGTPEIAEIDLSRFAARSIAFDSSWMGDGKFAGTAAQSFLIQPNSDDVDPTNGGLTAFADDETLQHGMAVTAFAYLVRESMQSSPNIFGRYFSLESLLSGIATFEHKINILTGDDPIMGGVVYEGLITAEVSRYNGSLFAVPISIQYRRLDDLAVRESTSEAKMTDMENVLLTSSTQMSSWVGDVNARNVYLLNSSSARTAKLHFILPKAVTQLLVTVSENQSGFQPDDLSVRQQIVTANNPDVIVNLGQGSYFVTVKQFASSQSLLFMGNALDADVPYGISME